MSDWRDLRTECGSPDGDGVITFPIFAPNGNYTLTVTVSDGLSGGGVFQFNPSTLTWTNNSYFKTFDISSTLPQEEFNPQNCPGGQAATPNQPPIVEIANGWYQVHHGQSLFVDGRTSSDPDNDPSPLEYRWDLNQDGIFDVTGQTATISWDALKNLGLKLDRWYTVTLAVSDGRNVDWFGTELILSANWNMEDYPEVVGSPPSPSLQEPRPSGGGGFLQAAGPTGLIDVSGAVVAVPNFQLWKVVGSGNPGPTGPLYLVKTLKGKVVRAWKPDGGQYNCHGFTVGGSKYSIVDDLSMALVLVDGGYVPRASAASIKNGDIVTWQNFAHSAVIKSIVLKPDGTINFDATIVESKNGSEPLDTFPFKKVIDIYEKHGSRPEHYWGK